MFESFTATGTVLAASDFVTELSVPALVVGGLGIGLGLMGWVLSRIKRAAK